MRQCEAQFVPLTQSSTRVVVFLSPVIGKGDAKMAASSTRPASVFFSLRRCAPSATPDANSDCCVSLMLTTKFKKGRAKTCQQTDPGDRGSLLTPT